MASFLSNMAGGIPRSFAGGPISIGPPQMPISELGVKIPSVNFSSISQYTPSVGRVSERNNTQGAPNADVSLAYTHQKIHLRDYSTIDFPSPNDIAIMKQDSRSSHSSIISIDDFTRRILKDIKDIDAFKKVFDQYSILGVYKTAFDMKRNKPPHKSFTTTSTVTISKFTPVKDYWATTSRAGDKLWIAFTLCKNNSAKRPRAADSDSDWDKLCTKTHFIEAPNLHTAIKHVEEQVTELKAVWIVKFGVVQMPVQTRSLNVNKITTMKESIGNRKSKILREIQVDPLLFMHYIEK